VCARVCACMNVCTSLKVKIDILSEKRLKIYRHTWCEAGEIWSAGELGIDCPGALETVCIGPGIWAYGEIGESNTEVWLWESGDVIGVRLWKWDRGEAFGDLADDLFGGTIFILIL